jgi:hypothetical protein
MTSMVIGVVSAAIALGAGPAATDMRPPISHQRLAFWPERVDLTRRWSKFMHGTGRFEPRLIVEHWTGSKTQEAAVDYWNDGAESTWAQFMIDPEGRITQFAPLDVVAKQAFGVSPWAIGIEHVGENSAEILGNSKERLASYRLTCWLRTRFDLPLNAVIGHAEAPANPLFHFTPAGWKWVEETGYVFHDDFSHEVMVRYRSHLSRVCPRG